MCKLAFRVNNPPLERWRQGQHLILFRLLVLCVHDVIFAGIRHLNFDVADDISRPVDAYSG